MTGAKIIQKAGHNLLKLLLKNRKRQEALLLRAIREAGYDHKKQEIRVDHNLGKCVVNGYEMPVMYPRSFFAKAEKLLETATKKYKFFFNGNMTDDGGRRNLLSPFIREDSIIISSDYGRLAFSKSRFNYKYFQGLAQAEYGLCPHQLNWPGDWDSLWTYRFLECCMVRTVPVVFEATPLGSNFTKGFYFVTDRQVMAGNLGIPDYATLANFKLVASRHAFTKNNIRHLRT